MRGSWRFLHPSSLAALAAWMLALLWSYAVVASHSAPRARGPATRQRRQVGGGGGPAGAVPPRRPRESCVVTGASSGLGWALACRLHAEGRHVVLACPDRDRGAAALQALLAGAPGPGGGIRPRERRGTATLETLDLRDPACVRDFALRLRTAEASGELPPLGLVVLNAASLPADEVWHPAAGAEGGFAANCLGHALLVEALFAEGAGSPRRAALAGPVRVVNVTSFTHRCVRCTEAQRLAQALEERRIAGFLPSQAYHASKWAALVLQGELHRRRRRLGLRDYLLMHADPGAVDTALVRHWPVALRRAFPALLRPCGLVASPALAAARLLEAVELDGCGGEGYAAEGGRYRFCPVGGAVLAPSALARSPHEIALLWKACRGLAAWGPGPRPPTLPPTAGAEALVPGPLHAHEPLPPRPR